MKLGYLHLRSVKYWRKIYPFSKTAKNWLLNIQNLVNWSQLMKICSFIISEYTIPINWRYVKQSFPSIVE